MTLPSTDALLAQQATDYANIVNGCLVRQIGLKNMQESDLLNYRPTSVALVSRRGTQVRRSDTDEVHCTQLTHTPSGDDYSWVPSTFSGQGAALLFDSEKQPKPAYYSVANALAAATTQGSFSGWYTSA